MARIATRAVVTLAGLGLVAGSLAAQQKVSLGKPTAESAESFTRIGAIRELPSGKVLVADPQDKIVQLVDLAAGTMSKVGREGSGPGEYALPITLVGLPDGTTLVHDMLNRRFLVIGADGKPGGFVEQPRPASPGPGGGMMIGGMSMVRGYDNQGRLYYAGSPFTSDGAPADSIPLLRWDRVKPTMDTLGFIRVPAGSASRSGGGGNVQMRVGVSKRWMPTEAWAVAGDGSVARVMPEPYRVVWMAGRGRTTSGPVVPYTPMQVTQADKDEFLVERSKNPGLTISMRVGPGGAQVSTGGPAARDLPPPEFHDTKPPFDGAANGVVQATPEGEVWVLRLRRAGDKIPSYDVFDKTGTLVKQVSLNPGSRVVGFGKGTVYVVRTDEDDLQYLQRYARP